MKLAARILVAGLATALLMGVALAPERAAAADVVREKCVSSGDWRTLETFWNTTATGWFRIKYGVGWLSVSRQRQTLDGYTLKSLQVGAWSKIGARMQVRVPQSTCVTYRIAFEGP